MPRTLQEAVGTYTMEALPRLCNLVTAATVLCSNRTRTDDVQGVQRSLEDLRRRLQTMQDMVNDAQKRLQQAVDYDELL